MNNFQPNTYERYNLFPKTPTFKDYHAPNIPFDPTHNYVLSGVPTADRRQSDQSGYAQPVRMNNPYVDMMYGFHQYESAGMEYLQPEPNYLSYLSDGNEYVTYETEPMSRYPDNPIGFPPRDMVRQPINPPLPQLYIAPHRSDQFYSCQHDDSRFDGRSHSETAQPQYDDISSSMQHLTIHSYHTSPIYTRPESFSIESNCVSPPIPQTTQSPISETESATSSENMIWIPKNQSNCRTLQNRLDQRGIHTIPSMLSALANSFSEIIMDPFGNYLFQKIVDYCDEKQVILLLQNIQENLILASKDQHGSRSIQSLIKKCTTREQYVLLMNNIKDHIQELSTDSHGNHVLQLCIEKFPIDLSKTIFDVVQLNLISISRTKYGCYVVQKCYEVGDEKRKNDIARIIINASPDIISNQFGNYALQYVIEKGPIEYTRAVYNLIKDNLVDLSKQKYSSNVLEKFILKNDYEIQLAIVKVIAATESTLLEVAEHRFGIYVVRRLLISGLPQILAIFQPLFQPILAQLQSNPKNKKNLDALEKPIDTKL